MNKTSREVIVDLLEDQGSKKPLGDGLPLVLKRIVYWMATPREPFDKDKIDEIRLTDPEFADYLDGVVGDIENAVQSEKTW